MIKIVFVGNDKYQVKQYDEDVLLFASEYVALRIAFGIAEDLTLLEF